MNISSHKLCFTNQEDESVKKLETNSLFQNLCQLVIMPRSIVLDKYSQEKHVLLLSESRDAQRKTIHSLIFTNSDHLFIFCVICIIIGNRAVDASENCVVIKTNLQMWQICEQI